MGSSLKYPSCLKYLETYNSNSESEDEETDGLSPAPGHYVAEEEDNYLNAKSKLPVPEVFVRKSIGTEFPNITNDNNNCKGRKRSFPHVRGNWASYVYIPFSDSSELVTLKNLVREVYEDFSNDTELNFDIDQHLSLTKTQVLQHHWIDSLWTSLSEKFKRCDKFSIHFDEFYVYLNEEKTRTFLAVKVFDTDVLQRLIHDCDSCLLEYALSTYYKNPSFHISIAWSLGDQSNWLKKNMLPVLNRKWDILSKEEISCNSVLVKKIEFKTGNKIYECSLQ